MKGKPTRFELRLPLDLGDAIDDWRRHQRDLPPRAEAARRLIEQGLQVIQQRAVSAEDPIGSRSDPRSDGLTSLRRDLPWHDPRLRPDNKRDLNVAMPERLVLQVRWLANETGSKIQDIVTTALGDYIIRELAKHRAAP
jgi:hypothetical protein